MGNIEKAFEKHTALITFITAGDPALAQTEKLIFVLEKAGADIIELGIPFSDPLADGPVIQASHLRALKKNVTLDQVFKLVAKVRKKSQIPLCFMLSYNLVLQYGTDKFYTDAEKHGVNGIIIPDLPPEELGDWSRESGVANIFLVAPTSSDRRIKLVADSSSGFIYLISTTGITGKRTKLAQNMQETIGRIKSYTKLPVAVGFGITTPAQAAEVSQIADGVIVGSAIVNLVGKKKYAAVAKLVAAMRKAMDKGVQK
ncbi:MAG: tryptophan synthase subunit alpha [Candidatus Margulisiibacteriota bacterium]